jgi:hypothetical protein
MTEPEQEPTTEQQLKTLTTAEAIELWVRMTQQLWGERGLDDPLEVHVTRRTMQNLSTAFVLEGLLTDRPQHPLSSFTLCGLQFKAGK